MIKQIIYGKRQSGKTTYACEQMLKDDGHSAYVCYNMNHVKMLEKQYPNLKGRFLSFAQFNKDILNLKYNQYKTFYFEWLNWIQLSLQIRSYIKQKNEVVIFDKLTCIDDTQNQGVKFSEIIKIDRKNNDFI